jgi:gluconokinase
MERYPCSPAEEIDGLVYFPRLCEKVRLMDAGKLHPDLHANLGKAMDLWTCQFLGVDYAELVEQIREGLSDAEAFTWTREHGTARNASEVTWWNSYMRNVGFRDDLSQRLSERIEESGLAARADEILTMFDYIDADEGRT